MKKIITLSLVLFIFNIMFVFHIAHAEQCVRPTPPVCYENNLSSQITGEDVAYYYIQTTSNLTQTSCSGQEKIDYEAKMISYNVCLQVNASEEQRNTNNTSSQSNSNDNSLLSSCPDPYLQTKINNAKKLDLELPKNGMQKAYDVYTAERKDQPIGTLSDRYSKYNPLIRTDVVDSISDAYGDTFKKFSDGTWAFFDEYGNYLKGNEQIVINLNRANEAINDTRVQFIEANKIMIQSYEKFVKNVKPGICKQIEKEKAKKEMSDINSGIISETENFTNKCKKQFGQNSIISPSGKAGYCSCNTGYEWNSSQTSCILMPVKTNDEICQESFGLNSQGIKDKNGGLSCNCKDGFTWKDATADITTCVAVEIPPLITTSPVQPIIQPKKEVQKSTTSTPDSSTVKRKQIVDNPININGANSIYVDGLDTNPVLNIGSTESQPNQEPVKKVSWFRKIFNWFIGK